MKHRFQHKPFNYFIISHEEVVEVVVDNVVVGLGLRVSVTCGAKW